MNVKTIAMSTDFSRFPAGRFHTDGPYSGQKFREEVLFPAIQSSAKVVVKLDGTLGYGSSFLEEAFGGLVREKRLSANSLRGTLVIESKDKSLTKEIWSYIESSNV